MDFGLGSLTSFTDGGPLNTSSSASADGDNTNANDFIHNGSNYNFGNDTPSWVYIVGGVVLTLVLLKAVK